ncbi:probable mannose-6-phosphate isomerase isoform X2 [Halyomorpha halys]|uniref:probable mannose-6-phosphate isomerase isoform X2 n=1 Tax=Halyomorpha halys TaxID=286706 RepID=UPI0006D4E73B|nr:probable mannose-6-phosphate isomerase isoform X2 [Halyomorpha halys]
MELSGRLSCNEWGKRGSKSMAGVYYWHRRKRNLLSEDIPYSTLIFSDNASERPTVLEPSKEPLHTFIEKSPGIIGKYSEFFKNVLPFQIKIICLENGMALGCHPHQVHAERLHSACPGRFSSKEHKPKLVIALKYLEVMAGFRPRNQITSFVSGVPELSIVIPLSTIEDYLIREDIVYLKRMFYYLMSASYEEIKLSLDIFFARMEKADCKMKSSVNYFVLKKLYEQFSYDCGVYAPLFLNHIILNPGQAIFLPSGTVHTYLHGDCLEVGTSSQNILRCGLTCKFKDIDEFLNIADFSPCYVSHLILEPIVVDIFHTSFVPPAKEMQVTRICTGWRRDYSTAKKK